MWVADQPDQLLYWRRSAT